MVDDFSKEIELQNIKFKESEQFDPARDLAAKNLRLYEVLQDKALRDAFKLFLERSLMSENLQLWDSIEDFYNMITPQERMDQFNHICQTFILPDAPNPVNFSFEVLSTLRRLNQELADEKRLELPSDVLEALRRATWDQLLFTCLPAFAFSDFYGDFLTGSVDSSQLAYSRMKAEDFFGMKIEGQLRRSEIVHKLSHGNTTRMSFFDRMFGSRKAGDHRSLRKSRSEANHESSVHRLQDERFTKAPSDNAISKLPNLDFAETSSEGSDKQRDPQNQPVGLYAMM